MKQIAPPMSPPVSLSILALCLSTLTLLPAAAHAQAISPESDISRLRVPVPLPRLPQFDLRLQTPEKAATPRAVEDLEFDIKAVRFEGGSKYPEAEMQKLFSDVIGKRSNLEALRQRVARLESRYREDGYFLTRVLIPPQQVRDGAFTVQIIEGFISAGFVEGGSDAERALIETQLAKLKERKPIDLAALEDVLLRLNDMPTVSASGTLRPGGSLGASELVVSLNPPPSTSFVISANNFASKTLGPGAFSLNTAFARPFGPPGLLGVGLSGALDPFEKLRVVTLQYVMPVDGRGSTFSLGGLSAKAQPKGSLEPLKVVTDSWSISPRYRTPLLRTRPHSIFADLGLSMNSTETQLDRVLTTADRSTVSEMSLTYQQNGFLSGNTQVTLSVFKGLTALGAYDANDYTRMTATPSTIGFNPTFSKQVLTLQRIQNFPANMSMIATVQGQATNDQLLAGERASFGGIGIGRGYDSGALTGDRGVGGLIELRWDQAKTLTLLGLENTRLQWFGSIDYARATILSTATTNAIGSAAAGLRVRNNSGFTLETMVADGHITPINTADRRPNPRFLVSVSKVF